MIWKIAPCANIVPGLTVFRAKPGLSDDIAAGDVGHTPPCPLIRRYPYFLYMQLITSFFSALKYWDMSISYFTIYVMDNYHKFWQDRFLKIVSETVEKSLDRD